MVKTEISNGFLAFLLVIAVVVSVVGTWYNIDRVNKLSRITGYGTEQGVVNLSVSSTTNITMPISTCAFGSGYVLAEKSGALLESNGTTSVNWSDAAHDCTSNLSIRNDGNAAVDVKINGTNATTMVGGTSPEFKVWSGEKEASSCPGAIVYASKINVNSTQQSICTALGSAAGTDEIWVAFRVWIPEDAAAGTKTAAITLTAS